MAEPDPLAVPEAYGERPWEQPGNARRDCPPHRGNWLLLLGSVALACGVLSCTGLPALVGIGLGAGVMLAAADDLVRMDAWLLDPLGQESTSKARRRAMWGLILSLIGLMIFLAICVMMLPWVIFFSVG